MIGLRINNYELVSELGHGGMGTVYLARHVFMKRKAAIKLLRPELAQDESLVTRFMNEARAANAVGHPGIVDIMDVGYLPDGRTPYLVMELLQGEPLSRRLQRERSLPLFQAIDIACQTATALAAAHQQDIVHRDLKPDNLFLVPDATRLPLRLRVKVLDFGIAKLLGAISDGSVKTRTGAIMGTPQYMSPEQCRGLIQLVDHRTDIYALGCILYEMVCGTAPFVAEGMGDVLMMHIQQPPKPPREWNRQIPEDLEAAILRALAKNADERFPSMGELQNALRPPDPKMADTVGAAASKPVPPIASEPLPAGPAVEFESTMPSPASPLSPTEPASSGDAPAIGSGPQTTLTGTAGQVLAGEAKGTRRRRMAIAAGITTAIIALLAWSLLSPSTQQRPMAVMLPSPDAQPAVTIPDARPLVEIVPAEDPKPVPSSSAPPADSHRGAVSKSRVRTLKTGGTQENVAALPAPEAPKPAPGPEPQPAPAHPAPKPGDKW